MYEGTGTLVVFYILHFTLPVPGVSASKLGAGLRLVAGSRCSAGNQVKHVEHRQETEEHVRRIETEQVEGVPPRETVPALDDHRQARAQGQRHERE